MIHKKCKNTTGFSCGVLIRCFINRLPLDWDLSAVLYMVRLGFGKKDHRGQMPFSAHHIKGTYHYKGM